MSQTDALHVPQTLHWRGTVVAVAIAVQCLFAASGAAFADDGQASPVVYRYQLTEEWSIGAHGPVYLREKRVKATYDLDVAPRVSQSGERSLELHFVRVVVEASVPAQNRSGRYDSAKPLADQPIRHHELIRPAALQDLRLSLKLDADGRLAAVTGSEAAVRRLDDLYDQFLRGSEQDQNTREFERQRLIAESLRDAWKSVFMRPRHDDTGAVSVEQSLTEARVVACIPTESWMRWVSVPVNQTVTRTAGEKGRTIVKSSASLGPAQLVETTMGDVGWSYTPEQLQFDSSQTVNAEGLVEEFKSSATGVLASTLSLGSEVPIRMTIRHQTELARR